MKVNLEEKIIKAFYDTLKDAEYYAYSDDVYDALTDYFDTVLISRLGWNLKTLRDILEYKDAEPKYNKTLNIFIGAICEEITKLVIDNLPKIISETTNNINNKIDKLAKFLEEFKKELEG